jgi:hypothetical protein
MDTMKKWRRNKPDLFRIQPHNHAGCDAQAYSSEDNNALLRIGICQIITDLERPLYQAANRGDLARSCSRYQGK